MRLFVKFTVRFFAVALISLSAVSHGMADDEMPVFTIVIKDHMFQPAEFTVPANVKIKLIVDNQDATPEEFESHELEVEKIIPGKNQAKVIIGPLAAGTYPFFGEFHEATAQGKLHAQ